MCAIAFAVWLFYLSAVPGAAQAGVQPVLVCWPAMTAPAPAAAPQATEPRQLDARHAPRRI